MRRSNILRIILFFFLAIGTSAIGFAQTPSLFTVSTVPTSRVSNTDHTALTGSITFRQQIPTGPNGLFSANLIVDYGVPITNTTLGPGQAAITIRGTGSECYASLAPKDLSVDNLRGSVTVTLPNIAPNRCIGESITLGGVRVSVVGTGRSSVTASISTNITSVLNP